MRCSGASRRFRAQHRSGFAESRDASVALSPPCCRSASPSARSSRCSPSAPASARPQVSGIDQNHFDIWAQAVASKPFNTDAQRLVSSTQGVSHVQAGNDQRRPRERQRRLCPGSAGPATDEHRHAQRPLVHDCRSGGTAPAWLCSAGQSPSTAGKKVGDSITMRTANGPVRPQGDRHLGQPGQQRQCRVHAHEQHSRRHSARPDAVNSFWITTTSQNHGFYRPHHDPRRGRARGPEETRSRRW